MANVTPDGMWRTLVMLRDQGCIAERIDPDAGTCYNAWGEPLPEDIRSRSEWMSLLEAHYVRHGALGPRHLLAKDHVALCPGHHKGMGPQGGRVWALEKGRGDTLRAYLEERNADG